MEDINIDSTSSPSTKSEDNLKEDGSSIKHSVGCSGVRNSQRLRDKAAQMKKVVDDIASIGNSEANLKEDVEKSVSFSSTLTQIDGPNCRKADIRRLPSSRSKSPSPASAKKKKALSKLKLRKNITPKVKKTIVKKESGDVDIIDVDLGGVKKVTQKALNDATQLARYRWERDELKHKLRDTVNTKLVLEKGVKKSNDLNHSLQVENEKFKIQVSSLKDKLAESVSKCKSLEKQLTTTEKLLLQEKTSELKNEKEKALVKYKADQKEKASRKKHRQEMIKKSIDEKRRSKSHMKAIEARANATVMLSNQSIQAAALSNHRSRFPVVQHGVMPGGMMQGGMHGMPMMQGTMHGMLMHGGGNMMHGNFMPTISDTAMIPNMNSMNNNMMPRMSDAIMMAGSTQQQNLSAHPSSAHPSSFVTPTKGTNNFDSNSNIDENANANITNEIDNENELHVSESDDPEEIENDTSVDDDKKDEDEDDGYDFDF